MQHENPLLRGQPADHRFITMGEIMLRLTPPNYDKIRVANSFEASYGGSEANIALATCSSLNAARSSGEPPPLPTMRVSIFMPFLLSLLDALMFSHMLFTADLRDRCDMDSCDR